LMAKQPDDRPPNMAAVRAALLPWAGADEDKPLDQSGDTAFQAAIAALQTAPLPSDTLNESWAFVREAPAERAETLAQDDTRFKLLVAAVAGVWVLVVLLLVLIFLLR